jgi:hypothetical protein
MKHFNRGSQCNCRDLFFVLPVDQLTEIYTFKDSDKETNAMKPAQNCMM